MAREKRRTETVASSNVITGGRSFAEGHVCRLDETRYRILKETKENWSEWGNRVLVAGLGIVISLLATIIASTTYKVEINALAITIWLFTILMYLITGLVFKVIGKCKMTERKELIKRLDEEFKNTESIVKTEEIR